MKTCISLMTNTQWHKEPKSKRKRATRRVVRRSAKRGRRFLTRGGRVHGGHSIETRTHG